MGEVELGDLSGPGRSARWGIADLQAGWGGGERLLGSEYLNHGQELS